MKQHESPPYSSEAFKETFIHNQEAQHSLLQVKPLIVNAEQLIVSVFPERARVGEIRKGRDTAKFQVRIFVGRQKQYAGRSNMKVA